MSEITQDRVTCEKCGERYWTHRYQNGHNCQPFTIALVKPERNQDGVESNFADTIYAQLDFVAVRKWAAAFDADGTENYGAFHMAKQCDAVDVTVTDELGNVERYSVRGDMVPEYDAVKIYDHCGH